MLGIVYYISTTNNSRYNDSSLSCGSTDKSSNSWLLYQAEIYFPEKEMATQL